MRYEYAHGDNKLLRLAVGDTGSSRSIADVFQAIFRGDASVGNRFAELEIVGQRRRRVDDGGRTWIEYELELRRSDRSDSAVAVIRVDPKKMLPVSMEIAAGGERREYTVDYPKAGPEDIYELGVPRDAVVEDRMPSPDLENIIRVVTEGRRDLDRYFAVVVESPNDLPRLVWRKGNRWRVDICQHTEQTGYVKRVDPKTDMARWWRERLDKYRTEPYLVCDGRRIYRYQRETEDGEPPSSGWKLIDTVRPGKDHTGNSSFCSPELVELDAYPSNLSTEHAASSHCRIQLDSLPGNGPEGSVQVTMVAGGRTQRWWLDPNRGYVAVKKQVPSLQYDWEYDDFRQSPRGVWYPTVIRWKTERGVQTRHYYLDFNVKLPDALFTRTVRKQ